MAEGELFMSRKERERLQLMYRIDAKSLNLTEATALMRVSYRQAKRIRAAFKKQGAEGLVHGARGGFSNHATDPVFKKNVLDAYAARYGDFRPTLASEKLAEYEGLDVNAETLRRWAFAEGIWPGRTRHLEHRKQRPRREHFGELVQMDGSIHPWFEERGPTSCLMVMIDDATSRDMVLMSAEETTEAAFLMLEKWILRHGVPAALYVDRRRVYVIEREPNQEEKRLGTGPLTEFGRACHKLGIEIITAYSPQAKGRVERRNAVYQDRWLREMRLRGIDNIAAANCEIDAFSDSLDQSFAQEAQRPANYHRALPCDEPLRNILCWESQRTLARDWTVSYQGRTLQIETQETRPQPRARITVRRRLDGSLQCLYGGHVVAHHDLGVSATTRPSAKRTKIEGPRKGCGNGVL